LTALPYFFDHMSLSSPAILLTIHYFFVLTCIFTSGCTDYILLSKNKLNFNNTKIFPYYVQGADAQASAPFWAHKDLPSAHKHPVCSLRFRCYSVTPVAPFRKAAAFPCPGRLARFRAHPCALILPSR
jgi:hypothetical protein